MIDKYICMMDGCNYISQDRSDALEHVKLGEEHLMVEVMPLDDEVRCHIMDVDLFDQEEE